MRDPATLREFLIALTCACAVAVLAARTVVWWASRGLATPPGEPSLGEQKWRMLAEARQICIDAAAAEES